MTTRDSNLGDVFEFERKLLHLSGFYPSQVKTPTYFLSAFINISVSYLQLLSMIGQMIIDRSDLSKLTDTLLFFLTHFTFLRKLTNFMCYKTILLEIENDFKEKSFYNFSDKFSEKIKACNIVARIFRVSCILCILFYAILPIIGTEKALPLPGWLPYSTEKFYFETASFQILSVCISAYNNSSIDILTWKLITIAAGELEILKNNLENLLYRCETKQEEKYTETAFKACVNHHQAILELVHKIEKMFSKGIFMQFLSSVVIICFTGFQLIVVPVGRIQFIFLIMYLFCMMCQVAMYCWYGHEVMTLSDEIGRCCYMSNWYNSNWKIRKSLIIFLERTKKPMVLTAGSFVTLSLTTLTGILRSSYSYFAVLQRVYQDS